ncbi:nucleotide-diphospho-sugar transferase [Endogone sp. FLAS-F59071]|nr:nucleotide-diphospho-sugar transferase [Endogone sp. FLAS-F59071]|eukprot:RUS13991.1 nucleotide-diphospho-sugar transferase [Endogone sp. FLAS-F59071]
MAPPLIYAHSNAGQTLTKQQQQTKTDSGIFVYVHNAEYDDDMKEALTSAPPQHKPDLLSPPVKAQRQTHEEERFYWDSDSVTTGQSTPSSPEESPRLLPERFGLEGVQENKEFIAVPTITSLGNASWASDHRQHPFVKQLKNFVWTISVIFGFLTPWFILRAMKTFTVETERMTLSIYGLIVIADFIGTATFASMNRRQVNKRVAKRRHDWDDVKTALMVVGYKEDPHVFEGCLKSIKNQQYSHRQVVLVVDGDSPDDQYMAAIFESIFADRRPVILSPGFIFSDVAENDPRKLDLLQQVQMIYQNDPHTPLCIMQPHGGKRKVMYTGFQCLLALTPALDAVVVTDSDTYLHPDATRELAFALSESPRVGAATGQVLIFNCATWTSFLSSLRYWFAFNMERSAQSYHGVVNCVSGPLGIYRAECLRETLDRWASQSFLGAPCTYGDDRHLTNCVLSLGNSVKFTHLAVCYTDTPKEFIRWVTQQTRWSKSFFREIPINMVSLHKHSWYMTYSVLFQSMFPFVMLYSLMVLLYFGSFYQMIVWLSTMLIGGLLKSAYAMSVTGDGKFFYMALYGVLYVTGYVPAKLFALMTLWDNSWGTSARFGQTFYKIQHYIAPVVWATILYTGIFMNLYNFYTDDSSYFGTKETVVLLVLSALVLLYGGTCAVSWWNGSMETMIRDFEYEEVCLGWNSKSAMNEKSERRTDWIARLYLV